MRGRNSLRNVDMIDSSWSSLYRLKHTQGSSPTNQITAIIIGYYYCIPCNNLLLINSALYHFVLYPRKQNHIYCIFNTTTVEQQLSWLNSGQYYKLRTNPIVQIPAVIRPVWVDYNDVVNCDRVIIIMLPLELSIKFMARATLSIHQHMWPNSKVCCGNDEGRVSTKIFMRMHTNPFRFCVWKFYRDSKSAESAIQG